MPKYLIQASYTAEGIKGLKKDGAAARRSAVQSAIKSVGGKLESFYFAFGSDDAIIIVDAPDNATAAAVALNTAATGAVTIRTTPLLTIDEVDKALAMKAKYRAPGEAK